VSFHIQYTQVELTRTYAKVIFFDQYHNMKVERGKGHLLDPYLTLPPKVDMRKAVSIFDMIDVRTHMTVRNTVLMLKDTYRMQNRIYESIINRPLSED